MTPKCGALFPQKKRKVGGKMSRPVWELSAGRISLTEIPEFEMLSLDYTKEVACAIADSQGWKERGTGIVFEILCYF